MSGDLVIFDCDGVLVDSEPISIGVLLEVFGQDGLTIPEAEGYAKFLGKSMATIAKLVEADYGLPVSEAHLDEIRERLYARFRERLTPVPWVAETVDRIGSRYCVASSSLPERIRLSLSITGLLARFEPNIYSSSMVKNGKPAPDLFLHAAHSMGCAPSRCTVIEDSPAGIEAARRAGMRVFGFAGGLHAGPGKLKERFAQLKPDLVFDDMRDLPALLADRSKKAVTG